MQSLDPITVEVGKRGGRSCIRRLPPQEIFSDYSELEAEEIEARDALVAPYIDHPVPAAT